MAYATPSERLHIYPLLSVALVPWAGALKRSAKFDRSSSCSPTDRSRWTEWRTIVRFPALEDVTVNLWGALTRFTDATRTPVVAKLCTFACLTELHLDGNNLAGLPDAIGAIEVEKTAPRR